MSAYWISAYREITDQTKVAAYAELAGPAIEAAGGRFVARGMPAAVHEAGVDARTVIVEFDTVEAARAAYTSPAYADALEALGDGAVRDLRIIDGVG